MAVNASRPHVLVLPEDDANRQIANGFWLQVDSNRQRQMQLLPVAGGWLKTLNLFNEEHAFEMSRYPARFMILLIDLDNNDGRLGYVKGMIPADLEDRVFILSTLTKPEALKPDLGSFETIGSKMAQDCRENSNDAWGHALLQHNTSELARLRQELLPILFSSV